MFNWLFNRSSPKKTTGNSQELATQVERDLAFLEGALNQVTVAPKENDKNLQEKLDDAKKQIVNLIGSIEHLEKKNATSLADARKSKYFEREELAGLIPDNEEFFIKKVEYLEEQNELLLSTLFEAQEELEQKVLAQHRFSNENATFSLRLKSILKRNPRLVDFEEFRVLSCESWPDRSEIIAEIKDCFYSMKIFERIRFSLIFKNGDVGLNLLSMICDNSSERRFKKEATLFFGKSHNSKSQYQLLSSMDTDHWHGLCAIIASFDDCFKDGWKSISAPLNYDRKFWGSCLQDLSKDFYRLPSILRFNSSMLKMELVSSDYEHLWFELNDVNFGNFSLPKFEFRISASEINQNPFLSFPKLEIPLVGGVKIPFDGWYAESIDDFGEKYELRFNSIQKKFDVKVFLRLSKSEQEFILSLFALMPRIIKNGCKNSSKLNHSIEEWTELSREILIILKNSLTIK